MKAILVCVNYGDVLARTLPRNRHHFKEVMIVTTPEDNKTHFLAKQNDCKIFATHSFYDDGAYFNKWKGLEEGLDIFGREGFLCIMDADIVWPKEINHPRYIVGNLYTPVRHLMACKGGVCPIPSEEKWERFHLSRETDFAGYTQIFHVEDLHLPKPPWHELNWKHAGGADTMFQNLWPEENKIRPGWQVLHVGPTGTNWAGVGNEKVLKNLIRKRGSNPDDRFYEERIK